MLRRISNVCNKLVQRYLPDPYIFALLLTALVFLLGIFTNHETPLAMIIHWGNGFWGFLGFSMQMVLVVVLGNCLATAPIFKRLLWNLAGIPKTPRQAVAFCTLVSGIALMLQWGFGLVVGAIFAKELAKRVKGVDYRLLVASAYTVDILTLTTHAIPLKCAGNPEELLKVTSGVVTELIPITETIYFPPTIAALVIMLVGLVFLNARMHPAPEDTFCIDPAIIEREEAAARAEEEASKPVSGSMTPAEYLENSRVVSVVTFVFGMVYIVYHFATRGFDLSIDIMNIILLFFGILLHRTPMAYIKALGNALKSAGGIILQFPFYAGIMGMMTGLNPEGLSLAAMISNAIVSVSNQVTYPLFTFFSAALVNLAVPSGGGQWAVQAPVMFPAAQALGVSYPLTAISIAWGDLWTNLIQPFWALPILGIAGLKTRDIMGYCVVAWLFTGVVIVLSLLSWTMFF